MRALILNSGMGTRMGDITTHHPKCMTELLGGETILSRQLRYLQQCGIKTVVMTTGYFDDTLRKYCDTLGLDLEYIFVKNPIYSQTNYIYSIYLAKEYLEDDLILMHGDLVFEPEVLENTIRNKKSCVTVSSTVPLPEKDFKAVIDGERVIKIGIEYFDHALAAQPLYKFNKCDWMKWLYNIEQFCEKNEVSCYAENAFNDVSEDCKLYVLDVKDQLCTEVDNKEDLERIRNILMN